MRRKILMGVLALALPTGMLAGTQLSATAGAPPNPITCSSVTGGVLSFAAPGVSVNGFTTSSKTGGATTVTAATLHCAGGVNLSTPPLSVAGGKNTKTSTKGVYQSGTFAQFIAAGGGLKKSLKSLNISGNIFKVKTSAEGLSFCGGSEVGFQINGQVKGTYGDKTAQLTVCLGTDSGPGTTGTFGADFGKPGLTIATANIDPVTSSATI